MASAAVEQEDLCTEDATMIVAIRMSGRTGN